jgi:hypothetical protein
MRTSFLCFRTAAICSVVIMLILCAYVVSGDAAVVATRGDLNTLLGVNQSTDTFETFSVADGAADSDLTVNTLDDTTIVSGQGPGLVNVDATYIVAGGLQWNGNNYYSLPTKTIMSISTAIEIVYDTPVRAMGVDLCAFSGYADSGTAEVYGPGGLIASIPFSVAGGASVSFFGYEDVGGITRVRFTSSVQGWSAILNDHTYGKETQSVSGTVTYTGAGTGPISIAAFDGNDCGDGDYTEVWIPGPGPYTLNLSPGAYYICACRDTNQNGSCPDPGEPASGFNGNPVIVPAGGGPVTGINISLQGPVSRTESVPTMTEWGMIIFIALAGLGSVYYLRRQKRA